MDEERQRDELIDEHTGLSAVAQGQPLVTRARDRGDGSAAGGRREVPCATETTGGVKFGANAGAAFAVAAKLG